MRIRGLEWAEAHLDYPHAHGLRRVYPSTVDLSDEDATAYEAAQAAYNTLSEQYESCEELPDEVDERFGELEAAIERFEAKRQAYAPEIVARAGAFVVLSHDGTARIERGFVRREDEAPSITSESDGAPTGIDHLSCGDSNSSARTEINDSGGNDGLSDALVRDLTAHRTLGLRIALGETPDIALIAVIHAMVGRTFYHVEASCLDIRPISASLGSHADGITDTKPAITLAERHHRWAAQLPQSPSGLWGYLIALDHDSRMALFAHCAALTVFAVTGPWVRNRDVAASVEQLAEAVDLNMSEYWTPTARSYFGRIPKALILAAVRDAVGPDAAERLAGMKKAAMAEAAERLVAGTGWLPGILALSPLPSDGSAVTSDDAAIATARPSMIAAE